MNDDTIIPVTATIEALLAECVGEAPELVQLKDWRTIALRLSRRMEESGLRIVRHATKPEDRARLVGPIRHGEVVLVLADGPVQTTILSTGPSMATLPVGLQKKLWDDTLAQAIVDLATARQAQKAAKS